MTQSTCGKKESPSQGDPQEEMSLPRKILDILMSKWCNFMDS